MDWDKLSNLETIKAIGLSIKGYRIKADLTQQDIADLAGVSKTTITRLETGEGNISLSTLVSIMKILKISNHLDLIFSPPQFSPSLKFKKSEKAKSRVKKHQKQATEKISEWRWGEDIDD